MLHLLNILLFVGMTSFFTVKTPVSNSEPTKQTIQYEAPQATCDMETVQGRIAAYFGVGTESVVIAPDWQTFTLDQFGNVSKGFLIYEYCGVDCTVITVKSPAGGFTYKAPCNLGSQGSAQVVNANPSYKP